MLGTLSIKTQPLARPQSATLPQRQFGNYPHHTNHSNPTNSDAIFLSNDKIILPVKQYSNKFLRDAKQKDQGIFNQNVFKLKRPFVYSRKDIKSRKVRQARLFQNKQNQSRSIKTQASLINSAAQSQQKQRQSLKTPMKPQTPLQRCFSTPNNRDCISTSRALQLFSRVFKNQTIERMRIRREIITRQMDVNVKQMKLQDKDRDKTKEKVQEKEKQKQKRPKGLIGLARKLGAHPCSIIQKPKKLFEDQQEDFQLAGW